ncbi:MAG: hypothetical protein WKF96_11575 [Solirubrobacteraceae bacterium]
MGAHYVCDYCGEPITDGRRDASMFVIGQGFHRDYHSGTCWEIVRGALDSLCGDSQRHESLAEFHERWRASRAGWTGLSQLERDRLLIGMIGNDRLSIKELIDRLATEPDRSNVLYSDLYPPLKALLVAGELDRVSEPYGRKGSRTIHRYFRQTELRGPIVDLDRAFNDPTDAEET